MLHLFEREILDRRVCVNLEQQERDDTVLIDALRLGDERAFALLVDRHHVAMLRVARAFVSDPRVAEEVVQDTWLGVLQGVARFEARSTLKTWIFRILTNRAQTRARREGRTIPFSAVWSIDQEPDSPAVDPSRFRAVDQPWTGNWLAPPRTWGSEPEEGLLSGEVRDEIRRAIDALPASQRLVLVLRDVEGCAAEEVCTILKVSDANQRVLLHRARSAVRRELERYFERR